MHDPVYTLIHGEGEEFMWHESHSNAILKTCTLKLGLTAMSE